MAAAEGLDGLARSVVDRCGLRFAVAHDDREREVAFRLRGQAAIERGWLDARSLAGGLERDTYDSGATAVHLLGWDGVDPVCTGRIVLPPGPLPTEVECAMVVPPAGEVVDVGRMVVVRSPDRGHGPGRFPALLAALYLEVRARGFTVACGMMAPNVRALARLVGFRLEVLGADRLYWGERRAPVRFEPDANAASLQARWSATVEDQDRVRPAEAERVGQGAAGTDRSRLPHHDVQLDLGVELAQAGGGRDHPLP